jgi:hypothetical protein
MNKVKVLVFSICISALSILANAQCNTDPLIQKCTGKLGDFTFLKVYKIDKPAGEQVEYSYVFSGNTSYIISLCDDKGTDSNIEVSLYDSNRKLVSSNKLNGKIYPAITYNCKSTGIYYMTYSMVESGCGISILGFKK